MTHATLRRRLAALEAATKTAEKITVKIIWGDEDEAELSGEEEGGRRIILRWGDDMAGGGP